MALTCEINDINKDLANQGIKIRIEQRGSLLSLRGPLPEEGNKNQKKVQRISLGLTANREGIVESKKLLQLLLLQLEHDQFNWDNWKKDRVKLKSKSNNLISEDINSFESDFFDKLNLSKSLSSKKTTWNSAYKPYLNRLQKITESGNQEVNEKLFFDVLNSYEENSRSRQQCSFSLGLFARYLNINLSENWKKIGAGYGIKKYNFRSLPDDKKIIDLVKLIPNESWKLVYGVMATYGLRNHEVFFSDYSSLSKNGDNIIRILPNTKTGEHQSWPFHPEWVELFNLNKLSEANQNLPKINLDLNLTTLQKVGRRVSEQFRRYKLPITPYDLRHAWAIRTIHIGLPDTVSARMMGHSVSIHNKAYHHWITRRDQQQAVDAALNKYSKNK